MHIVVDSGCDLIEELVDNVDVAPLILRLGSTEYVSDTDLDVQGYITNMLYENEAPRTSAPTPLAYLDSFESGGDEHFAVTLSSKLSSSYQSAIIAKGLCENEGGDKRIHIFDSLTASIGQTLIALKVDEYIKENEMFSEIVKNVNSFIKGMRTFVVLEKYDNLVKNGRVSTGIAKLGSLLGIKPICKAVDGEIMLVEKTRGTMKALMRLVEIVVSEKINFECRILGISHVRCLQRAELLRDEIMRRVPFRDCVITEAGGLSSTYADVGGIILAY